MRRDAGDASIGRILLEHLPDDLFGHGLALYPIAPFYRSEYAAVGQTGCGSAFRPDQRCTNDHLVVGRGRASARLEIRATHLWGRLVVSVIPVATEQELKAEIERLRAENESLKRPTRGQTSLKVSEKGALSVYGMGRFPVTLYREQWEKLLGMADEIRAFIQQNDQLLKKKE
jgi:hypothetical protein